MKTVRSGIDVADSGRNSAEVRAWASPGFRRLWVGSTASSFGSEVAEIALPLLAMLTLSASAGQLGLLRAAQFLPFLLAAIPLGLLVDRRARHRLALMVGADLGRFVLVASIPLAVWVGVAGMELLYAVVFAVGLLTVLYQIADFAFLPSLVTRPQLVDANGKIAAAQSANEIGGRGLGGLLVQAISAPAAVCVNAFGFLVSAVALSRIRVDQRIEPADPAESASGTAARPKATDGLRLALRNRYVRPLLLEATTYNVFNEVFVIGLLLHAVRDLGIGPAAIGLVFTVGGAGSFLGAWFGSRVTGRFGYGRVLLVTLLLGNGAPLAAVLAMGAGAPAAAALPAGFLVLGVGIGVANVHAVTLRQTAVPPHVRGQVNAAYRLISWGALPLGAAVGGALASGRSAELAMVTGAVGIATASAWVLFSAVPRLRSIDHAAGLEV